MWKSFEQVARITHDKGGAVAIEWPEHCRYWGWPCVQRLLEELSMQQISFHGCVLGLKNKDQTSYIKKPWCIASNLPHLISMFGNFQCDGKHDHVPCAGVDTRMTENYTPEFARAVHDAWFLHCSLAPSQQHLSSRLGLAATTSTPGGGSPGGAGSNAGGGSSGDNRPKRVGVSLCAALAPVSCHPTTTSTATPIPSSTGRAMAPPSRSATSQFLKENADAENPMLSYLSYTTLSVVRVTDPPCYVACVQRAASREVPPKEVIIGYNQQLMSLPLLT